MSEAPEARSGGAPIARAEKLLRQETRGRRAKHRQLERGVPGARKTLRSKKSNSKERPAEWSGQIRWTCPLSSKRGREECRPGQVRCRRSAARGGDGIRSDASGGGGGRGFVRYGGGPQLSSHRGTWVRAPDHFVTRESVWGCQWSGSWRFGTDRDSWDRFREWNRW